MMKLIVALSVLGLTRALDVQLVGTTCDETLPVTAEVYLRCADGARCTFGEESSVYGTCKLKLSLPFLLPLR